MHLITSFGAETSPTICTSSIQAAIDQAAAEGGGTVVVPAGLYLTGPLQLRDHVELRLEAGSTLRFSDDPALYPPVMSRWEGFAQETHMPCLYAKNASKIAVTGQGTLDGQGPRWWASFRAGDLKFPRPRLAGFDDCDGVLLRDVTLIDSPSWTVHPLRCSNVHCDNLSILNPADSPNTDGINPESCKNVRISGCHIDVGDDCIAIKAGTEDAEENLSCENITITGCTMVHGHGGVVIGSEMSGSVRNVTVANCVFQDTDRGIRLKSRRGRGGMVEDLLVSNVVMDNVMCPFIANLYYFCGPRGDDKYVWDKNPYPITDETPQFRRLHFSNVTARRVHAAAGFLFGLAERSISDVTFRDIRISMADDPLPGKPAMMAGIEDMAARGFYVGFARDIDFSDVVIEKCQGPAFTLEGTADIRIRDCRSVDSSAPLVVEKEIEG